MYHTRFKVKFCGWLYHNTHSLAERWRHCRISFRVDAQSGLPRQRVAGQTARAGACRELHCYFPTSTSRSSNLQLHFHVVLPAHHTSVGYWIYAAVFTKLLIIACASDSGILLSGLLVSLSSASFNSIFELLFSLEQSNLMWVLIILRLTLVSYF